MGMLLMVGSADVRAQTDGSGSMAATVRTMWPGGVVSTENRPGEWSYEEGVLLDGMTAEWWTTADGRDFEYVRTAVDKYVGADGSIKGFSREAHSLDEIEMGRSVLMLYRVTRAPRYYKAAKFIHDQLTAQPRTASGGFWHKGMYPNQMWADGAYMAEPFLAEYAATFQQPSDFDEVAKQLLLMDSHMRDLETGLLRHGWDESRQMPWADKGTGLSPEAWARANGWYAMALVDVLDWMPVGQPGRGELLEALNKTAASALAYQDKRSGVWWQVMNRGGEKGNFPEASASCMFTYALAKGVRMGYLASSYLATAQAGWSGIKKTFVREDGSAVRLTGTVKSAGLGGKPYRPGTYDYYIGEKAIDDDAKGVGAYLLAQSEMTQSGTSLLGQGRTAAVDAWFNSQTRTNAAGGRELFHYKWDDDSDSGFAFFGRALQRYGMRLTETEVPPSAAVLKGVDVYVIASPATLAKNPNAHFMDVASADAIEAWVEAGGVLVLMGNDGANMEFEHFNMLGDRFGLHFTPGDRNKVEGNSYEQGEVKIPASVFGRPHTTFMKDVCTIAVSRGASKLLTDGSDVLMATAAVGRGTVYAVVDPWVYNEYTDGRKLPPRYDTYAAAIDLSGWLLKQVR